MHSDPSCIRIPNMEKPTTHIWQGSTFSVDQTLDVGSVVAQFMKPGDIIALEGDLGAGKTQFVRGLARTIGVDERQVSSPTFVLVHEYEGDFGKPILVHLDAYRLTGPEDLESIGWDESQGGFGKDVVVAVEWATRMLEWLGNDVLLVTLTHMGEEERFIEIQAQGRWIEVAEDLKKTLQKTGQNQ